MEGIEYKKVLAHAMLCDGLIKHVCEHLIVLVQYAPNPDHSTRKYPAR